MTGLGNILRKFGKMVVTDKLGNTSTWLWDYAENKARLENEMTQEQWAKSEKVKWLNIAIEKAKPNLDKIKDVDEHLDSIR